MKNTLLFTVALLISLATFAQNKEDNCYHNYLKVFKERGTYPMTDGEYDNIIITESSELGVFCYTGRAVVQNGKVNTMYLKFVDGLDERITKAFKSPKKPAIYDGVSLPYETVDGVKYVVFFTSKLRPKRKSYLTAPNPGDL